jgi:hypothetical protein
VWFDENSLGKLNEFNETFGVLTVDINEKETWNDSSAVCRS